MIKEKLDEEFYRKHFRVAIFGSARIRENYPAWDDVYKLAHMLAAENIDIITGGGPGLMQAACKGHMDGRKSEETHSIGLNIIIPADQHPNRHLDVKREFERFSERLDVFMILSNAVVVAPGGIGTLLELMYTWQLVQVKHICNIPIILMGDIWKEFLKWVEKNPLKKGFIVKRDLERLFFADDYLQAYHIINKFYEGYLRGDDICFNFKKYKIAAQKGWFPLEI